MIHYNSKAWLTLIFRVPKSDTFKTLLPSMLMVGGYTFLIAYVEKNFWHITVQNVTALHSLLGFVLSLLLVFRTNTAYERWWEGRRLWGEMVNNTRNLALKVNSYLPADMMKARETFGLLIVNYVFALKEHLRGKVLIEQLDENEDFSHKELEGKAHIPNALANRLFQLIDALYRNGHISGDQLISINDELRSFTNICGACERIKNTPIPYSYSLFLKKFIFVYIATLPLGFVPQFGYWTVPVVIFTFYVLTSLELIAEEIEDPFGSDANDLPTDEISLRIKVNIKEIMHDRTTNYLEKTDFALSKK